METLDGTDWDILIVGTGLKQSLLALALSRSDKKVLHIDQNSYYGGNQAAFSLQEAEAWATHHASTSTFRAFTNAIVHRSDAASALAASRSYSLALAPELIFTRSTVLPALVSSQTHGQLEFQAVGSWFVLEEQDGQRKLQKVPNGREDIFQDASLDLRSKRSFMKLIRFITDEEAQSALTDQELDTPVSDFLQHKFGIASAARAPLLALALSLKSPQACSVREALPRIARHIQSIGLFGAGFNAVTPKWGGLAEISQVACRAGAVGGAVYCLGKGVKSVVYESDTATVILSDGERVKAAKIVGPAHEIGIPVTSSTSNTLSRCICIVPSALSHLFPATSEGGVTPAGAVICLMTETTQPVYLFVHSSDTGECPVGQCVLYATTLGDATAEDLKSRITEFLTAIEEPAPLWTVSYEQHHLTTGPGHVDKHVVVLEDLQAGLALEDSELERVRRVWHDLADGDFMKFPAREGTDDGMI